MSFEVKYDKMKKIADIGKAERSYIMAESTAPNSGGYSIDMLKALLDQKKMKNEIAVKESGEVRRRYLDIQFPVARNFETIKVNENDRNLEAIVTSDFWKYRGITTYEAIWSQELKCIECEMRNDLPDSWLIELVSRYVAGEEKMETGLDNHNRTSVVLFHDDSIKVSLGYASKAFAFLSLYKTGRRMLGLEGDRSRYRVTFLIEGISCKKEEDARKILEKVSNSLFYQFDILVNHAICLAPRRESYDERIKRRKDNVRDASTKLELKLDYEYDEIPMSLYWFAKSSNHSFIFKYFALYQALEYYYPIYGELNVKNRIQNLVKDPAFDVTKDSDVLRLLNIMKTGGTSGYGDEREQLAVTLRNITTGEDIISYLEDHVHLMEYYKGTKQGKLSGTKLRVADPSGIMADVVHRIYDIRCRIVHNKASESENKIMPMTEEAGYLAHEVELLQFIVRKAIIANSRPLSLK